MGRGPRATMLPDDTPDAVALAERLAPLSTPADIERAVAEMLRWAIRAVPPSIRDALPPGPWDEVLAAVERVAAGGGPEPAAGEAFARWAEEISADWATNNAVSELRWCVARALAVEPPEPPDLAATAYDLVRAHGLWLWDELLSENSAYGWGDEQEAQEQVRDRVTAEAHRAFVAILSRLPGAR